MPLRPSVRLQKHNTAATAKEDAGAGGAGGTGGIKMIVTLENGHQNAETKGFHVVGQTAKKSMAFVGFKGAICQKSAPERYFLPGGCGSVIERQPI